MVRTLVAALAAASFLFSGSDAAADLVGRAISAEADLFTNFNQVDPDYDIPGDMFGIRSRLNPDPPGCANCDGLPFAIADDSLVDFPMDEAGIIKNFETDSADFFGVADTVNETGNNVNVASWTFDISTVTSDLMVSIDMAAMGDFENVDLDFFDFEYQIDGSGFSALFTSAFVDTNDAVNGDGQSYTMEGGLSYIYDDPMNMNGTRLINDFQTLTADIAGTGDSLELKFSALSNGAPEGFAFRNILVEGTTGGGVFEADFDGDGDVDGNDFLSWQAGFPTASGADKMDGDFDNDGDVDGNDFLGWQTEFPSPGAGGGAAAVPEPAAISLLLSLGLAVASLRSRRC